MVYTALGDGVYCVLWAYQLTPVTALRAPRSWARSGRTGTAARAPPTAHRGTHPHAGVRLLHARAATRTRGRGGGPRAGPRAFIVLYALLVTWLSPSLGLRSCYYRTALVRFLSTALTTLPVLRARDQALRTTVPYVTKR